MDKQTLTDAVVLDRILATGIVAVVRLRESTGMIPLAHALDEGGVAAIEITLTMPGALEAIRSVRDAMGPEFVVGAGTVLDADQAAAAIAAGADFIVGPTVSPEVIATAKEAGRPVVAGALTPTEVQKALVLGADIVKMFPGRVATPGYFRDILGPLPTARLMPTGNVDLETAPQYIAAGAVGVGVGKALVDPVAVADGDWGTVTARARRFREAIDQAKRG
ncbi:bifunctional 4-hydroxy-2-oxoglutarate aldolase/2-dehydro-3-deoxy-phosphogluconate aldolase [Raineyella sp. LH-20]|uniref:bifunctional 4-hydroxy-2-oxoglutarate aldolase/2-dehydro-3-deoxy-phosphogluconate aldolase n=1 Tax=Raineyella sp. LH-20 TaxID=3081204 RepID=UPI0029541340|nr:bifunctional 4-hydroxy-2-oxoglutarate aldolase/2-dehydro-3-deoxy-phosphogluconate aldolase [Raineyella sp. LH-20]WOP19630.1 bifunctional 4-hydroxy-2-oxoglutarate aldolase/2-dehydro-3-deoxy-phosphogluconate aldolase [Raineyella sp. LH-20]